MNKSIFPTIFSLLYGKNRKSGSGQGRASRKQTKFWASSIFHIRKILSCNTENSRAFLSWMELLFLWVTPSYLIEIGNYIKLFCVSFSSPDIHREIPYHYQNWLKTTLKPEQTNYQEESHETVRNMLLGKIQIQAVLQVHPVKELIIRMLFIIFQNIEKDGQFAYIPNTKHEKLHTKRKL